MIYFKNVTKKFNKHNVIKNINLEIQKSKTYCIVGPSGAGKTTLVRLLAGLEKSCEGEIWINSVQLGSKSTNFLRKNVSFVFQNFNLFPHFTVMQNITYAPINAFKMKKEFIMDKALELLKSFNINEHKDKYPSQLSGGQKQRVAICRSLILDPKIVILDEPTSALDPENIGQILQEINLIKEKDITILIVTHDIHFAKKVSDKVIFMDDGKVLFCDDKDKFFDIQKQENGLFLNMKIKKFLNQVMM